MRTRYDVVVFGGGTAGVVAAVQAARAGAATLLVEKNGMLGGTMTVGGVNAPAHFFAWGRQVIAGIGWELVRRTLEETGRPVPSADESAGNAKLKHLRIDRAVYAALCDEAVLDAGVELLLHAMPAAAVFRDGRWSLTVCTKTGLAGTSAAAVVDATGDANVVALAGLELVRPEEVQPATLRLHYSGYDPEALDYAALKQAADREIASGRLKTTDLSWSDAGPESLLRSRGRNTHIRAPGAETSAGRTAAEIEGRRAFMRAFRFLRRQPGLENLAVDDICSEAGIRETVTIRGRETMKVEDYEAGRLYEDAVCYAFYPVDEHRNDGRRTNFRLLRPGVLPTIPRGALLPEGARNLIVAGRCLSSDRETNSAVRVECPCMAMGQAAGAMAALTARTGTDPSELPLAEIHALLRAHGAVVPGDAGGSS